MILDDPVQRADYKNNRTMIESRMLAKSVIIAFKIIFYTILVLYYTGIYWISLSMIFFEWNNFNDLSNYFIEPFLPLPFEQKIL